MSDAKRLYTKVQDTLKKILTTTSQSHLVTMSLMISTLVRKGRCHLTQLAQAAPSNAKTESTHRRFQRFIASDAEPNTLMLPFIQPLLRAFEGIRLPLALDVSEIGRGCVVLMLGILYKGSLHDRPMTSERNIGKNEVFWRFKHDKKMSSIFELPL